MPEIQANGIDLFYETSGEGTPVVFVHEFAGDRRSWEDQIRYFSRRYHTVTYNARGFPPSEVPEEASQYTQDHATDDLAGLIQALGLAPAHAVGLSMGGFATLHLGLRYPELVRSVVVAGCGYGSEMSQREAFQKEAQAVARRFEEESLEVFAKTYTAGPTRVQLERKDPIAYAKFQREFVDRSAKGSANTMRTLQATRPSVYELEEGMRKMEVPALILTGDEDDPHGRPDHLPQRGASDQSRRARHVQPDCPRIYHRGRRGPLAPARPPLPEQLIPHAGRELGESKSARLELLA